MKTDEFLDGIKKLELAYNKKFSKDKLNLWYEKLKVMNYTEYMSRIDVLIENNDYMPNVAEILNKNKKTFANYEQREYGERDFSYLYANR